MAELKGTRVLAPITPPDDTNTFATHIANFGKGNIHSVENTTARDAITEERREVGMLCYVQDIDKMYQLKGGKDNSNWTIFAAASTGGGSGTGNMSTDVYDTNSNGIVDKAEYAERVDWNNIDNRPDDFGGGSHTHHASSIIVDENNQFVSTAEKNEWNLKQDQLGFVPENAANKNKAQGYAGLDTAGKIPVTLLPDLSSQKVHIVKDDIERDKLVDVKSGDISYNRTEGTSYIWDGSIWLTMVDNDWAAISIDWETVTNKPNSPVVSIDEAVKDKHTHANMDVLNATTESFTSAIKNLIGDAKKINGIKVDDSNRVNGAQIVYQNGTYILREADKLGTGDMKASDYDKNGDGIIDVAESANSVAWGNISGKPPTFSPMAHKHTHSTGAIDELKPEDIGAAKRTDFNLHVNSPNPHKINAETIGLDKVLNTEQIPALEKGKAEGVATLGVDGKIPLSQIPTMASGGMVHVVADEEAMLLLEAVEGDKAVRTDLGKTFALKALPASDLNNWQEMFMEAAVSSVNGQTGNVTLVTDDIAETVTNKFFTDERVKSVKEVKDMGEHVKDVSSNPHKINKSHIGLNNVANQAQIPLVEKGQPAGVATLGLDGKLLKSQLPEIKAGVSSVNSKVGDVDLTTTDIAEGINKYYSDSKVDARIAINSDISSLKNHMSAKNNPHEVTKAQVGLGNVENIKAVPFSEKGLPNGIAPLGADGKIEKSFLPILEGGGATSNTFVVSTEKEMLELTASVGDLAIRNDVNATFILQKTPASVKGNWIKMLSEASVVSVNNKTGAVTLKTGDISESGSNQYFTEARMKSTQAWTGHLGATNPHNTDKSDVGLGNLLNEEQVTKTQVGKVNGVAPLDSNGKVPASHLPESSGGTSGGSGGYIEYEALGSSNYDCMIRATGPGISFSKVGSKADLVIPEGVKLLRCKVHFTGAEVGIQQAAIIDFDATNTMGVTSWKDANYPTPYAFCGPNPGTAAGFVTAMQPNMHSIRINKLVPNLDAHVILNF